jgi:hypothetical protein
VVARNARDLVKVLGLSPTDGMNIEVRSDLNNKIIEVVAKKGLTHSGRGEARSHFTHSRDYDSEPQHAGQFHGSDAACVGFNWRERQDSKKSSA